MLDLADEISKIEAALKKQGFKKDSSQIDKDFPWKPDIIVTKDHESQAFLIRQAGPVPTSLIDRLASTRAKKEKFHINVVFLSKPAPKVIKDLSLRGLGIQQLDRSKLSRITISKNFSSIRPSIKVSKKPVTLHKKMKKTEIFISSQQKIGERKTACEVIKNINNTDRFPVYAILVEDIPGFGSSREQTKKCIDKGLKNCDWFVGILADVWREWVEYEVRQAIKKHFKPKDITIYVKSSKKTEGSWNKLLRWVGGRNIKYLPFSDIADMRSKFNNRILGKLEIVHKRLGIPMYN